MVAHIGLNPDTLSMSAAVADKLIARGQGDAALLYLFLLRHGGDYRRQEAAGALGWNVAKLSAALSHLEELGLVRGDGPEAEIPPVPDPEDAPEYSTRDINEELSADGSPFSDLVGEVERLLGRKCSVTDLRILLEIYDHLAMSPEVILLLTAHLAEQSREKYGPGRRLRLSEIRGAAYRWKKSGLDTLDTAEGYLKKLDYFRSQEGTLLAALSISGRAAVEGERKYLRQWLDWGFGPEAVALAYEKTVLRTGELRWPYCNGILRKWHEKGLHDPDAITAAEAPARGGKSASRPTAPAQDPAAARRDARWMQEFLKKLESEEG